MTNSNFTITWWATCEYASTKSTTCIINIWSLYNLLLYCIVKHIKLMFKVKTHYFHWWQWLARMQLPVNNCEKFDFFCTMWIFKIFYMHNSLSLFTAKEMTVEQPPPLKRGPCQFVAPPPPDTPPPDIDDHEFTLDWRPFSEAIDSSTQVHINRCNSLSSCS